MNTSRFCPPAHQAAIIVVLLLAAYPAQACREIHASFQATIPGYALMGGHAGLVIAILAGFLERPFLSVGGIDRGTLWLSICLNMFSVILTAFVSVPFGLGSMEFVLLAFGLTIVTEWWILSSQTSRPALLGLMVIIANVFSAFVIGTLPFWRNYFGTDELSYYRPINQRLPEIASITLSAVIALMLFAVARAWSVYRLHPTSVETQPGFEVILK